MLGGRRRTPLAVVVALLAASVLLAACSDDEPDGEAETPTSLVRPTTTTTTTEVGVGPAPTSTFLPNTPVVVGREAILTGVYSQTPTEPDGRGEDVCHYVTIDDGTLVSVAFTDTYLYGGAAYPGPADYVGDPEEYADDPLLVHPGDRIAVRGEVVEAPDDPCALPTGHPGLTVLVSTFAPS
jgi:major membrane immunogen (membrane-anchored lipoprotein)